MVIKLSPHFTLDELEYSCVAKSKGIKNNATLSDINNLKELCNKVLEPLRAIVGKPIKITSGYRCPTLNKLVGGEPTSQHCFGQAVDIEVSGMDYKSLYNVIKKSNIPFDQLIQEHSHNITWVHISYKKYNNRHQCLLYDGKKYIIDNN